MKQCPKCAAAVGSLSLAPAFLAEPIGSHSLAGVQVKVTVREGAMLTCSACDLRVEGWLENPEVGPDGTFVGGHFVPPRRGTSPGGETHDA
jgi:hypothetical protein